MALAGEQLLHATAVSLDGHGVLLTGRPGSGKSTLALRLIDRPGSGLGGEPMECRLVGDDQVMLRRTGRHLSASAPPRLAGLIEIRGVGLVRTDFVGSVPVILEVRCGPRCRPERLPDLTAQTVGYLGVSLRFIDIDPDHIAAPARIRAAVQALVSNRLGDACA